MSATRSESSLRQICLLSLLAGSTWIWGCGPLGEDRDEGAEVLESVVSPSVLFSVGEDNSGALYQVADGKLLGDSMVLAERSSGRLRFYDGQGRDRGSVGRLGDGPGEFRRLAWIEVLEDRILAYDLVHNRITEFSSSGELIGTINLEPRPGFGRPTALGAFSDGSLLVAAWPGGQPRAEGVSRATAQLFRYSSNGRFEAEIGSFLDSEVHRIAWGQGGQASTRPFFGRQSAVEAYGDRVWVVENEGGVIRIIPQAGGVTPPLHVEVKRAPVRPEDISRIRQEFESRASLRGAAADLLSEMPIPDSTPYFGWESRRQLSFLELSRSGDIWILPYGPVGESVPVWTVFSQSGHELFRVRVEREHRLLGVWDDRMLILTWDERDVEIVQMLQVRRGETPLGPRKRPFTATPSPRWGLLANRFKCNSTQEGDE
jgi:hypothetical protein